ncbi:MAG: protein translocase subunit SecD, partial [Burkholderiaceae bacterium]|nr:protein translocase subunit SecD [Burkholderiaceae bacterium]
MNRYALWKYILIIVAVVLGALYTTPNLFGEAPALQISSAKATLKVEADMPGRIDQILKQGNIKADSAYYESNGDQGLARVRFADSDSQFAAKSLLEKQLNNDPANPSFNVTFNLVPNTPRWMRSVHALPMARGLDLRGGVHFLLQVDTAAYLQKRQQSQESGIRTALHDKSIHYAGITSTPAGLEIAFRDDETRGQAKNLIQSKMPELTLVPGGSGDRLTLTASMSEVKVKEAIDEAVAQNIVTLGKRINGLGLTEPIIQRQGANRIVVELPGVGDVARARDIIGRTATLELRMVDETVPRGSEMSATIQPGSELLTVGSGVPVVMYKDPIVTGDYISSAQATTDTQTGESVVAVGMNSEGGRKMFEGTRGKVGKLMGIVLIEKGKSEVLTVAVLRAELGANFQITEHSLEAASDLALLLRSGALAAPMEIVAESTVGPQLGAENIKKGFDSTLYGFAAITIFMVIYYLVFGFFSVLALGINLLLLVGLLSGIQATLTLPGMAAIALTLGMAIDANVLINERVREELRAGNSPQLSIANGFEHAWATILDSNITTLIVGLALLVFGSGPVRGFAIVHCLGITTSIFSSVFVSRGVVNLWYGRRKKLAAV